MKISSPSYDAVWNVAFKMRERDYLEFSAVSFADTRADLAKQMAERYGNDQSVHVGYNDDFEAVCVGGSIQTRPNVITLLFFATDQFPQIALPVTRYIKKQLLPRLVKAGVHRIEAVSIAGYDETHGWLKTLGLKQETQAMHGYGKGGEAFIQFAWSKDAGPFGA